MPSVSSSSASSSSSSVMSAPRLTDVHEEPKSPVSHSPRSPYHHQPGSPSTSALSTSSASARALMGPRKPSSLRTVGGGDRTDPASALKRASSASPSTTSLGTPREGSSKEKEKEKDRDREKEKEKEKDKDKDQEKEKEKEKEKDKDKDAKAPTATASKPSGSAQRIRTNPHLPHAKDVERAPATIMYWSRAPVHGAIPMRSMRAHSVTLVDTVAWLFGGCDDKGCWRDVYCFDTETMHWTHPEMLGDIPPPCRAHTATLVDRKIVIFGGGQGPIYYDSTYVLDTTTRTWTRPASLISSAPALGSGSASATAPSGPVFPVIPAPRRAHTAVLYNKKIWVFGGGNGMQALNDVWTLDVGGSVDRMRWEEVETRGRRPWPRGYHTANLIGNVMVVVGGSDGKECFSDIWCLNLDSLEWSQVTPTLTHRRLSHSSTQVGSFLFITGGHDGSNYVSELLLFNLVSLQYEPRTTLGKPPAPRGYHITVLADSRLWIFGGFNGHDVYDDVWTLDLAAAAYLPQVTKFRMEV